jgi:hypothetical protein
MIRDIADELNSSLDTCQAILMQDLGMRCMSAKRCPECQGILGQEQHPCGSYPPYSPDLAPCDFFLIPRLKSTLKGKRFQDVAEIQLNNNTAIAGHSQTSLPEMH